MFYDKFAELDTKELQSEKVNILDYPRSIYRK